jgi:hypothetical protein
VRASACVAIALACAGLAPTAAYAFEIAHPAAGARVAAGSPVQVAVTPAVGEVVTQLHVTAFGDLVAGRPGALAVDVPVPSDAVGPLPIVVFAVHPDGKRAVAFVRVEVDPGPLDALRVGAPAVLTRIGEVVAIEVRGDFADGVVRDLTHPDTGTRYSSSAPEVLAVHPSGLVQARSRGSAQLLVESRGRAATATLRVEVPSPPDHGIPTADAGPDQTVAREALVDLDAGASRDPDGEALRFHWQQIAGPLVLVRDTDSAHPFFRAPFVEAPETLEFSVDVADPHGAQSFPAVVRITVTP